MDPLVREFVVEWARNMEWGIRPSLCVDALEINVPSHHIMRLHSLGDVESFSILLGDLGEFCSASLGNNSHDRNFGLILNCPAWLRVASRPEFQGTFERQLVEVVQHEMAHFKYQIKNTRSEILAHCRGIAAMLSLSVPSPSGNLRELIVSDYPELATNPEIQQFILEGCESNWRLIRIWLQIFKTTHFRAT
jgi:hypothetical protein